MPPPSRRAGSEEGWERGGLDATWEFQTAGQQGRESSAHTVRLPLLPEQRSC